MIRLKMWLETAEGSRLETVRIPEGVFGCPEDAEDFVSCGIGGLARIPTMTGELEVWRDHVVATCAWRD